MPRKEAATRAVRVAFVGVAVDVATGDIRNRLGERRALHRLITLYGRTFGRRVLLGQAPG
jgi:hypothetical protein